MADSYTFDSHAHPPIVLFLSMSTSNICNFRCRHCHIWMNDDPANGLTTEQRVDVVRQFAELSPGGTVILAGGEVTMDWKELFALTGACRDLGLGCGVTTNGSGITTAEVASRVALSGITVITVSLDSHRREVHEYTRGIKGAYDGTLGALRLLIEAKQRLAAPLRVVASCVVFDRNVDSLGEYAQFCRELGVDHVDVQLLAHTFSNKHPRRDVFFEGHFWFERGAKERAKGAIERLIRHWSDTPGFLLKRPEDLSWISSYIDDPDYQMGVPICGSHERNLVVGTRGEVSLCFNAAQIFDEPSIGNVSASHLSELWNGATAQAYRRVMNECLLNCGALNCHRRRAAS